MTSYDHLPEIPMKGEWTVADRKAVVGEVIGVWTVISEEIRRIQRTDWKGTKLFFQVTDGVVRCWRTKQECKTGIVGSFHKRFKLPGSEGLRVSPEEGLIQRWRSIMSRCHNPKDPGYPVYGGRGIALSEEFQKDVHLFCNYVSSLPNRTRKAQLDRIDNNRGYERGNLRWATATENNRNKRNNVKVVYQGTEMLRCEFIGLFPQEDHSYLDSRLKRGATPDEAATERAYKIERKPFRGELLLITEFHLKYFPEVSSSYIYKKTGQGMSYAELYDYLKTKYRKYKPRKNKLDLDTFEIDL